MSWDSWGVTIMVDLKDENDSQIELIERQVVETIATYLKEKTLRRFRFGISGYDQDTRPLFQVPEVRTWCRKLYTKCPSIFLFIEWETIYWFFLSIAEIEILKVEETKPTGYVGEFLSSLSAEQQATIKQQNPSTFLGARIRLGQSVASLIKEIIANAVSTMHSMATTQEERDPIEEEFVARLKQGIPWSLKE